MIKNVLFDLGGVLVELSVHRSIHAMMALMSPQDGASSVQGSTPVTGKDLLGGGESELMRLYQTGHISTEAFIETILSVCRPGTTREQVLDAWYAMLGNIPEQRLDMLRRLKKAGLKVYILSNINEAHVEWVKRYYPELHDICEHVFYSNEIQIAKPDEAAYEYVKSHAAIVPEETLYIDDLEQNILVGKRAGFVSLQAAGDEWLAEAERVICEFGK